MLKDDQFNFLHVGVGFYKGLLEKNLFSITHAMWWSLVNAVLLGAASKYC